MSELRKELKQNRGKGTGKHECNFVTTYAHLLQTLCQDVDALLLVDEDEDRRIDALLQKLNELVPLLLVGGHVDELLDALHRLAYGANVDHGRSTEVGPGHTLHRRRHSRGEHDRLFHKK